MVVPVYAFALELNHSLDQADLQCGFSVVADRCISADIYLFIADVSVLVYNLCISIKKM